MNADYPHSATLQIQAYEDGPMLERLYRWRVEDVVDRLRAVGQYKRSDGQWTELRNPDRLHALLVLAPAYATHTARTEDGVVLRTEVRP